MRPKWKCLAIIHSSTFKENQTQPIKITPHTSCQVCWWRADDLGFFAATKLGHLEVIKSTIKCSA